MTQLEAARQGAITPQMQRVAAQEKQPPEAVRDRVAAGRAVICANRRRGQLDLGEPACGIGEGLRTKVNANIGSSADYADGEAELAKVDAAVEAGADTLMDLSTGGPLRDIRRRILERCAVPLGTVPIYDAAVQAARAEGGIRHMTAEGMLRAVREHAEQGVDFLTLHCGVTRAAVRALETSPRVAGVVSRGGSFLATWMRTNARENPLYEQYDEVLAICREHDAVISLGDGLRPGALADAMDLAQVHEVNTLAELCLRAREAGVQAIVEGPGHVPPDQIQAQVRLQKELCKGAPFYVLGPLVTDVAPGHDHITAAIGGALAAASGVDFLCYVTPAEHLCLPDVDHVREGVLAARIAGHAADVVKGVPGAAEWDRAFSEARRRRDWDYMLAHCLDPRKAAALRGARHGAAEDACSMCAEFCALKVLEGETPPARSQA
jgi:phosphomethylpyrimidine synthase